MKSSPAATLFLAACVLLALSAPPTVSAVGESSRHHGPQSRPAPRRAHATADDDEEDDQDEGDDDTVNDVPKRNAKQPPTNTNPMQPPPPPPSGNCRREVRQEIRDLSTDQRTRYFRAIRAIMRRPSSNRPSEYDQLVYEHQHYNQPNHGFPSFLPWHRIFIRRFEMALQRVDSSIVIPYWDWSADASAPELSPVFSSTWYGKNGNQRRRGCIEDGYFKDYAPYYQDKNQGCISRRWNGGQRAINAFVFPEQIANIVARSSDYNRFRLNIEGQPHAAVHNGLGSTFATMYSPSDPVFWLHHTFIDKIFMDWQLLAPSTRLNQFNGVDHNRRNVNPNSMLIPYNLPARVGLQTTVMGACISYAPAVNAYRGRRVPQPPTRGGSGGDDDDEDRKPIRRPPTKTKKPPTRRVIVKHPKPTRRVVRRIRPRSLELSTAKDTNQAISADDNAFPVDPSKAVKVEKSSSALEDTNLNTVAQQDAAPAAEETSKVEPIKEEAPKEDSATKVEAAAGDNNSKPEPKVEESKPATKVEESKPQEPAKAADEPKKTTTDEKKEEATKTTTTTEEKAKPHEQVPANFTTSANATTNTTDLSGTKVVVVDAPKPSDLPKTCKDADGNVTPCASDRENILDLRAPAPIPEEWIKSNNLDVELIRQQESETRTIAAKLNALDGYVSPAALWNKEDFMAKLAKKGTDFKCVVGGKVIKVEYDKENVTTGYRTVDKVKKQIERVGVPTYKPIEYLETDLNKILGRRTVKRLKKKFNKTPTVYKEIKYDDDDVCEADEY